MAVRQSLDVRLDGNAAPIGRLEAFDNNDIAFTYAPDFMAQGRPISLSMPLAEERFGDARTRAFFDNLLPENDQMERVIEREGLERSDIVGILAHLGADCAGAISCLPAGSPPIKVPGILASDYSPIGDDEIVTIAARLADRAGLPAEIEDPSPVAGVQRKLALTLLPDGRFALPAAGLKVPTTHILKVPARAEGAEALQEDAACRLAQACGFEVSRSEHVRLGDTDALLIERFDRVIADGVVYRVHQEDFAQALGLPASLKYERHGKEGRRFDAEAARSVIARLAHPAQAIETFLLATIFNLAIGNTDNHAKNYGVLYIGGDPVLAPLYDLLPIRLHQRCTHQLAYNLGDATHFDDMTTEDLNSFLAVFGLEGARAKRFLEGPVRTMLETLEERSDGLRALPGLRLFDDMIGRELGHFTELAGLQMNLRERDWFGVGQAGWPAAS